MHRKIQTWAIVLFLSMLGAVSFACQPENLKISPEETSLPAAETALLPPAGPLAAPPEPSPTEVEAPLLRMITISLDETVTDPPTVLNRRLPQLEGDPEITEGFNQLVKAKVEEEKAIFLDGLKDWKAFPDMPHVPHSFLSGYEIYSASQKLISLKLEFSTYVTGAAHPYSFVRTVDYDLLERRELALKDIFKPGVDYLSFLSAFCEKNLTAKLGDVLFTEGLAPTEENFRSWGLVSDGLVIEFDPYQVAPYAAGPQQVLVTFEKIKGMLVDGSMESWEKAGPIVMDARQAPPQWPTPSPTP